MKIVVVYNILYLLAAHSCIGLKCKIFMAPWRKRQMLGSIITISELIVAMFALRICATVVKYRYNYCIPPNASRLRKGEVRFFACSANALASAMEISELISAALGLVRFYLGFPALCERTPLKNNRLQFATPQSAATSMEAI